MKWKKKKLLHALKSSVALVVWCDDRVARVFMFYHY